jgi:hypothetical protein
MNNKSTINTPSRAVVSGYGIALVGLITAIQYLGIVDPYPLPDNSVLSAGMLVLGTLLAILGVFIAYSPDEVHRGTEPSPYWLLGAAVFETVAFAALVVSELV